MAELVHSAQNFINAEDTIIAKKRKRAERMETDRPRHSEQGPHPKKGRIGEKKDWDKKTSPLVRNQQYTPLNRFLCKSRTILLWSGWRKWREIPTSAIGTSIFASTGTMGMTQTNATIWSSRLKISSGKENWEISLDEIIRTRSWRGR